MKYTLKEITAKEKDILYKLLQFALYDSTKYNPSKLNSKGEYDYKWFNSYFMEETRKSYLITNNDEILGFVMLNEYLQYNNEGKSIAEFLILPSYRRHHIGSKVATQIFNMFPGTWEVSPLPNSEEAYLFWQNTITKYTKGNYKIKDKVFIFTSEVK